MRDRRGNVIPPAEPLIDDDSFVPRLRQLTERGVEVVAAESVERMEGNTVFVRGDRRFEGVSTIVTCALRKSRLLERRVRALGIPVHAIGDARWPRKSAAAACEAFELAARL